MFSKEPAVLGLDRAKYGRDSDEVRGAARATTVYDLQKSAENEWLSRSRDAYVHSTSYFDQAVRPQVAKNFAHFHSKHASSSKYNHATFQSRSKVFRPKTRSMVRRSEAATAVALFATADLIDVEPWNDADPEQVKKAQVGQKIMQYRLEHTMPWFLTACGAAQDAHVTGTCISHIWWRYETTDQEEYEAVETGEFHDDGEPVVDVQRVVKKIVTANRPEIDVVPIENFRVDPACDWRDPVNSSPYCIHSVSTYFGEVRRMLKQRGDPIVDDDGLLWAVAENDFDSIRTAREGGKVDKYNDKGSVPDYRIVWIRKHIHRIAGRDWYWETVGDTVLLREPELLETAYPHLGLIDGKRPYVMGGVTIESHTVYRTAPVQLVEQLQEEANDISNLRLDSAKNAMFGRWKVKRSANIDTATLKAGIPQSVISVGALDDFAELKQQDVSQSAFASEDRINVDFDEVSGNFSLASVASNRQLNETVGGMNMLSSDASQVKEYEIRVFVETWVEPTLQQLWAMESMYEDDEVVLGKVAAGGQMSMEEVQDALAEPGTVRVNVGFNATSPEKRVGRLALAMNMVAKLAPQMMAQIDGAEVTKEVFGAVGYSSSSRFFHEEQSEDPEKEALKQQVQQLTQMLQGKQIEMQSRERIAQGNNQARVQVAAMTSRVTYQLGLLAHAIAINKSKLEEVDRLLATEQTDIKKGELRLQREALSHEINHSSREFQRVEREGREQSALLPGSKKGAVGGAAKGAGKAPAAKPPIEGESSEVKEGEGAPNLPGNDKAGVIARQDFGLIPDLKG